MATEALAGTGFHVENDVYSRMATDKIVVQGKYYFNPTPPIALSASIRQIQPIDMTSHTTLPTAFTYPLLVKANRTATILPGEGFHVPLACTEKNTVVEIEPRAEAPQGFIRNHLQDIENEAVFICNMSTSPIKIKKHTPLCQIRETVAVPNSHRAASRYRKLCGSNAGMVGGATGPPEESADSPISKVKIDPGRQFSEATRDQILPILQKHKDIFEPDLPGYNHAFGKIEATFEWASPARPPANRARMPDYNVKGNQLYNAKAKELMNLGVFRKTTDMDIQPAFKNNSFLVRKQSAATKQWDQCGLKDVRMVTAFSQLQKYIKTIPAKVVRHDKILQACANWNYMAEFDLSNMFFQIPIKQSTAADLKKLGYLCIQTDEGTLVYVQAPQGLPGISEYEEELTDTVFGDIVNSGKSG